MHVRASLPASIGRFRIDALIGAGGMGEVYKAFDPTLQRVVALKTVRSDIDNPDFLARLYREAQACARLRHPNVVTVYEAGEVDALVYLVMEFLEGEDLRALLRRGGLSMLDKIDVLLQMLAALDHTHAESVIHRDIKPSNVHRGPDGVVKVVDFGLAQVLMASPLTRPGAVMCTPEYASPEQLRDETLDARTDVYSTGAVAYEMFAGRQAFSSGSGSVGALILKAVSEPPPPMDVAWSRAFPALEQIVSKAMAKAPAERFQSAAEMRDALVGFREASRDAIVALQGELDAGDRRAASDAATLIVEGRRNEAEAALAATLKLNPDARAARTLLEDTRRAAASEAETLRPAPGVVAAPATPTAAPAGGQPALVPPPSAEVAAPVPARPGADMPNPPATPSRHTIWLGAAAAALLAVGLWVAFGRPQQDAAANAPVSSEPAATTADAGSPGNAGPATAPNPAVSEAVSPTAPPPSPPTRPAPTAPASTNEPPRSAAVTTAASSGAVTTPSPAAPTAKQLFARPGTDASPAPGLRFRLTRLSAEGVEGDVDPAATTFHSGDRVRFTFESNIDGYLYVVQQGSSGRWTVLFPGPAINGGRNAVGRGARYEVPAGDWFLFDDNPGTEQLFVFLSREPMQQLPGFDRPVTRHETIVASVVDDLRQTIRSRDLVFEKDRPAAPGAGGVQATYVVNRAEVARAVAASISLVHAR